MKSAPNLKHLPRDKMTEAVIFAGSDAWAHARQWEEGLGQKIAGDKTPPVYLGKKQLAALANTTIIDKGRDLVRIYRAGNIDEGAVSAIVEKLAVAGTSGVRIFKGMTDKETETLNAERMEAIRERVRNGDSVFTNGIFSQPEDKADELKPRVESRPDGVYWLTPKVDRESGEILENETWLCSPLEVVGSGSDAAERYLVLRWKAANGKEIITRAISCADIGEREGWRTLKSGGVQVTTKSTFRAILADWLQQSGAGQEWRISHTSGWHHGAYVMPDGEVIGEPETPILFNGRSAAAGGYDVTGTAESWRNSVARLVCGNPSMMLGIAASMAAPLIGLVGADGFGVHLFEQSSAGKTTTANIASSVWGSLMRCASPGTERH